jgi:3-isopropylmalate dehydrogenase
MKNYQILVLPGDGIGPEVVKQALRVLEVVATKESFSLDCEQALVGGVCLETHGVPIQDDTITKARAVDAVLLGAVGGPQWDQMAHAKRPEQALLRLRSELGLFANLRPVKCLKALLDSSPLKSEIIEGVDLMVVRELCGGIYFGQPRGFDEAGERRGFNTLSYTRSEIERVARRAFEIAQVRNKRLMSVDKANILESSQLWRELVTELGAEYPDVQLDHMYVDNCAMQLVRNPRQFDVIVTGNMFGDILSDEAAMLTGSIGMLPSASLGALTNSLGHPLGMYEPVHGSAPDIAGKGLANPLATILSVSMMLRYSLGQMKAADALDSAVEKVLSEGARSADLGGSVSTKEMGDLLINAL